MSEKNAPAERPDERKVCGTQKNGEDRKEWQKLKRAGSHIPASARRIFSTAVILSNGVEVSNNECTAL